MKPRFKRSIFLALAIVSATSLALAQWSPAAQSGKSNGAKDLYYQQLEKPQLAMNTGLQYWIELHRKGQKLKVTNKTKFYSGDKIRFHIRPNIDGYAYVFLKLGSKGNREVLFPLERFHDDNRISRGRVIAIPTQECDMLEFDNDKGKELVGIVLSRKPINAQQYLNGSQTVIIASGIEGSKDLVPSRVMVQSASTQEAPSTNSEITTVIAPGVPSLISTTTSTATATPSTNSTSTASSVANLPPDKRDETGVTTVVQTEGGILGVDIEMDHL